MSVSTPWTAAFWSDPWNTAGWLNFMQGCGAHNPCFELGRVAVSPGTLNTPNSRNPYRTVQFCGQLHTNQGGAICVCTQHVHVSIVRSDPCSMRHSASLCLGTPDFDFIPSIVGMSFCHTLIISCILARMNPNEKRALLYILLAWAVFMLTPRTEGFGLLVVSLFSIVYMLDIWFTTGRDKKRGNQNMLTPPPVQDVQSPPF